MPNTIQYAVCSYRLVMGDLGDGRRLECFWTLDPVLYCSLIKVLLWYYYSPKESQKKEKTNVSILSRNWV